MCDYYAARAKGGAGLITTQFFSINEDDMMPYSLALYDDKFIPGIRKLVQKIHCHETKVSVQLMHPGMLMVLLPFLPDDTTLEVPSITPWMIDKKPYQEVDRDQIKQYINDFAVAAGRAAETGVDAIELHACHGCLLSTFLSPATNRRTGLYGGSVENRARFAKEVVAAIRSVIDKDLPLIVRINGNDDVIDGITPDEVIEQASILKAAGADAISISSGLEYWSTAMAPSYYAPGGSNVDIAARVRDKVKLPVITSGKITPELAADVLSDDKVDFIALGRPLLADPELPARLQENRPEDIRRCLYCNNCLKSMWRSCAVNPFLYKESMLPLKPAETAKHIMVIGGGLAGMQSAVTLAERGHKVTLYEKERELGGQWYIASKMYEKEHYISLIDSLQRKLTQLHVTVEAGVEVTVEQVKIAKPGAVIIATGAIPRTLNVLGIDSDHVIQANDVIMGSKQVKGETIVIGSNMLGMELSVSLAENGHDITLVSHGRLGGRKGPDEKITFRTLMRRIIDQKIPLYLNTKILEITGTHLILGLDDEIITLPADTIVLAVGAVSQYGLADQLKEIVPEVYTVGDCVVLGNAAQAIYGAAHLAIKI